MSKIPTQVEVFVAGGGPAGLAAAIAARLAGFDVAVADCARPPIDKACGEGIMPDGLAALLELGVTPGLEATSSFSGIRFLDAQNRVEAEFPHGVGYGIRRTVLHGMMVRRAEQLGISLHWGSPVTGLSHNVISVGEQAIRYRWLVGADGQQSRLRRLAGLDTSRHSSRRFGFRRHYQVSPWSDHVEVHWSDCGQMYVTPVDADHVCIAFITGRRHFRFEEAFPYFPALAGRLRGMRPDKDFLGALTTTTKVAAVQSRNIALVGEASGSVDAVTGEGLSLAFRQAFALAAALQTGDLLNYEWEHRRIARVPRLMSSLMLMMDRHPALRSRALRALSRDPMCFAQMLAIHTGVRSLGEFGLRQGLSLGWNLLAI